MGSCHQRPRLVSISDAPKGPHAVRSWLPGGSPMSGPLGAAVLMMALLTVAPRAEAYFVQQGPKLVGTDAVGSARQGISVAVSADGNTAIVGGGFDDFLAGAAWVWTRSGGVWSQEGTKLVGSGAVGAAIQQGISVAVSADGNTAVVGGSGDNSNSGAAWVWTRSGGV